MHDGVPVFDDLPTFSGTEAHDRKKRKAFFLQVKENNMANFTEKLIMQTFEEMLEESPFNKITVSALTGRCEISSNTFYYHYKDIFDLLEKFLLRKSDRLQEEIEGMSDWADQLKFILHRIRKDAKLIRHIHNSVPQERLENFIFTTVEERFYAYIKQYADADVLSMKNFKQISDLCCFSIIGYIFRFFWSDMKNDVDTDVDNMKQAIDDLLDFIRNKNSADGM